MSEIGYKICEACKQEKAVTDFYFRKDSGKYRTACKKCKSVVTKEQIAQRVNAITKICTHCNIEKSVPCKNFDLTKPEDQKRCFH
ncbi:MAG TPA: hypothetical protein VIL78_03210, partial [Hanamia sp.]